MAMEGLLLAVQIQSRVDGGRRAEGRQGSGRRGGRGDFSWHVE